MAGAFKTLMIGLFVTAAAAVILFMFFFLHPSVGNEGKILRVRFTNIDKVSVGTRVTYGGKPVGEVIAIEEIGQGRTGRTDENGRLYLYELTLRVDSSVQVFNTDEVSIRTSGLLGERNIEITPIAPKKGQVLIQIDQNPIYASTSATVEDTLSQLKDVATKVTDTLDPLKDILKRAQSGQLIEKITRTMENVESITAALNKPKQLEDTLDNVHLISQKVNRSWEKVDDAIASIKEAFCHVRNLVQQGQQLFDKVLQGEGTLGKLLVNDEAYLRTTSLMSKLETTLDDINHYGLLFHTNKQWQRLRARRMNMLQKLRTPQEFRNYFNDEINQISTSISRVSMLLECLGADPYCCDLTGHREFAKVFAELMRRVKMLEEEVRLYNTQLAEPAVHQIELGYPPLCPCQTPCPCNP